MITAALFSVGLITIIPKKYKLPEKLFLWLFAILLVMVFAGNNSSVDQLNYRYVYDGAFRAYFEPGYMLLCSLMKSAGFNYLQFKLIIGGIVIFVLKYRFSTIGIRAWSLSLVFWACSSFWMEIEQSRFYIAMVIVLFATKYLQEKTTINVIKYIALVFVAMQFHTSMSFYLLLAVMNTRLYSRIRGFIFLVAFSAAFVSILNNNDWSFVGEILYAATKNERLLMWFNMRTNFGYIGPLLIQVVSYALLTYIAEVLSKHFEGNEMAKKSDLSLCYMTQKVSEILFLAIPLYMISTDFVRVERGFMLPYFLCVFQSMKYMNLKQKMIVFVLLSVLVLGMNFVLYGDAMPLFNTYFKDMLTYNEWN